jgi:hypothetical protein
MNVVPILIIKLGDGHGRALFFVYSTKVLGIIGFTKFWEDLFEKYGKSLLDISLVSLDHHHRRIPSSLEPASTISDRRCIYQ